LRLPEFLNTLENVYLEPNENKEKLRRLICYELLQESDCLTADDDSLFKGELVDSYALVNIAVFRGVFSCDYPGHRP